MAKELPYFRFTAFEWLNDDISLESYELKGLFIDICSYYWFKDCSVTIAMLEKRFNNTIELVNELMELNIIKFSEDAEFIKIEFLNKQFDVLSEQRKRRQKAGSKGGKKKSSNAKAKLKQSSSYKDKDKEKDKDKYNNKDKEIKNFFNSTCINLPKITKLSDQRKKAINTRAKEYDFKTIGKVFKIVSESEFLNGKNNKGWSANFDWILNPTNFLKILEGNYNNKIEQNGKGATKQEITETIYKHFGDQKEK